ncbi:hypothetical protein DE146DRAFT_427934 [Phaeosphaeria sp. MPI-PUGE-AT-0046c]|nr:hypothetical protein DE146DRAFT_427934 [Phaeosphaeria sp. MPI-PUGE-AT-0046c]
MSNTVLITGASSGLGLAFIQHYVSLPSTSRIIAIDIAPLQPSTSQFQNITFFQADISNDSQIRSIASQFSTQPINLLIHSAGIRGLNPQVLAAQQAANQPGDVAAAETYSAMDSTTMLRTFSINTLGTFNAITSFLPSLLLASDPKAIILSSRMGSVTSNVSGGGYAYRASKAALNAVVRSFSLDVPDVAFLLLHPGRVETGLVGWKEEGAMGVEESVRDCVKVIEGLGTEGSGGFVDRFGMEIPW